MAPAVKTLLVRVNQRGRPERLVAFARRLGEVSDRFLADAGPHSWQNHWLTKVAN